MKRTREEVVNDNGYENIDRRLSIIETNLLNINSDFKSIVNDIEQKSADLKSTQSEWNIVVDKLKTSIGKVQNPIKLDVSGKIFKVSKETLISIENTYFYGLVGNMDTFKPLDDGSFFIERNPLVFDRILDYLRTGKMDIRGLIPYALDMLRDDLDYYCIPLPAELQVFPVCWDINRKSNYCTFSNNNLTVSRSAGSYNMVCNVIGNIAVDRYTVKIDDRGDVGFIMIGFTTGASWNCNGDNDENSWFIDIDDGSIYGIGLDGFSCEYSTAIDQGDYVTVIRQGTTICFEKNKVDLGVCQGFTNIPDQPLFPTIRLGLNASVSLVNDY